VNQITFLTHFCPKIKNKSKNKREATTTEETIYCIKTPADIDPGLVIPFRTNFLVSGSQSPSATMLIT